LRSWRTIIARPILAGSGFAESLQASLALGRRGVAAGSRLRWAGILAGCGAARFAKAAVARLCRRVRRGPAPSLRRRSLPGIRLVREELRIGAGSRNIGNRAIREAAVGAAGIHRQPSAHQAGLLDLDAVHVLYILEPPSAKILCPYSGNGIADASVSI
jgi:hypothetical protein